MPLSVADRLAIMRLVASYDHATDQHDAVARANTFAPDGVFDPTGPALHGRDAILHAVRPADARNWRHWVGNFVIEGGGDEARARCYLVVWNVTEPVRVQLTGIYHDRFRRVDGEWLFAYRDFRRDGLAQPA